MTETVIKKKWGREIPHEEWKSTERQVGGMHYVNLQIQPIEYITRNNLNFMEGSIIKYVTRHSVKGGIADLRKAQHFLEMIADIIYGEEL